MINLLALLLISLGPWQMKLNDRYKPRKLPRGQWYEVFSLNLNGEKVCFNQFLSENFKESYWGKKRILPHEDCSFYYEKTEILKEHSEIYLVEKTLGGVKISLDGEAEFFQLWNFKKNNFLWIGQAPPLEKNIALSCGGVGEKACRQGLVNLEDRENLVCPNQREGFFCEKSRAAYCFEKEVYCR